MIEIQHGKNIFAQQKCLIKGGASVDYSRDDALNAVLVVRDKTGAELARFDPLLVSGACRVHGKTRTPISLAR